MTHLELYMIFFRNEFQASIVQFTILRNQLVSRVFEFKTD